MGVGPTVVCAWTDTNGPGVKATRTGDTVRLHMYTGRTLKRGAREETEAAPGSKGDKCVRSAKLVAAVGELALDAPEPLAGQDGYLAEITRLRNRTTTGKWHREKHSS